MKQETIAIHSGLERESPTGDVAPPIHPSTVFEHSEDNAEKGYIYTRAGNPNRAQLEKQLADLEEGAEAAAFASGVAASAAVFQSLDPGDHLLAPLDVYHGTRELLSDLMQRWGLEVDYVDMTDLDAVRQAIKSKTRLLWLETPSNPLLQITDIAAVKELAEQEEAIVCVDNTWPTPVNQRPLEMGAELVVHSTTKYLGGHSDLLGGAVIANSEDGLFGQVREIQTMAGAVPSPSDCWLLSRSIRTLPYRVRAHNENARQVAEYLQQSDKIEQVLYPGLSTHEGYKIAQKQMFGAGGMISFLVRGTEEEAKTIVQSSELITPATSLGGVESTWEHRLSSEGEDSETPPNLIRISVGLEHPSDIISDIETALEQGRS